MSSAGLGSTTTLLGGSPSGQAAGHVNNQTQFTLVLGGGGMKGVAHVGVLQALTERGLVPSQIVGSSVGALVRSEEHTSELQSHSDVVCRLLLEKKNRQGLNTAVLASRRRLV